MLAIISVSFLRRQTPNWTELEAKRHYIKKRSAADQRGSAVEHQPVNQEFTVRFQVRSHVQVSGLIPGGGSNKNMFKKEKEPKAVWLSG